MYMYEYLLTAFLALLAFLTFPAFLYVDPSQVLKGIKPHPSFSVLRPLDSSPRRVPYIPCGVEYAPMLVSGSLIVNVLY